MINTTKPTTSLTNTSRDLSAYTWATILTTWASETLTWLGTISDMTNTSKPKTLGAYTFDEIGDRRIDETGGVMSDSTFMINTPKP